MVSFVGFLGCSLLWESETEQTEYYCDCCRWHGKIILCLCNFGFLGQFFLQTVVLNVFFILICNLISKNSQWQTNLKPSNTSTLTVIILAFNRYLKIRTLRKSIHYVTILLAYNFFYAVTLLNLFFYVLNKTVLYNFFSFKNFHITDRNLKQK